MREGAKDIGAEGRSRVGRSDHEPWNSKKASLAVGVVQSAKYQLQSVSSGF